MRRTRHPSSFSRLADRTQLILTGGIQGISSYDPQTGSTNWELDVLKDRVVGSPILAAGMIIAGYGEGGGGKQLFAIRPGEAAKDIKPKVEYEFSWFASLRAGAGGPRPVGISLERRRRGHVRRCLHR